jgi:Na+/H+-dicarboxylate symporter
LVTSIAGVVLGILLNVLAIPIPIVGVVLGAVALNQIKRTGQQGRGLAIAGIAIGTTAAALLVIFVIAFMAAFTSPSLR